MQSMYNLPAVHSDLGMLASIQECGQIENWMLIF
jgi:hypothetical protein